ncbi:membrane protein [Candidatus Francisella endociliophora]|uniref:Membrane protein n=1 Tax=Candidatus Francisella endociliophora TaxID=653937 RepID=A0A097EMZ6_9GAMM|nr:hypothetical protein [Francisella sp. FSC1006]AIT08935.1 membrane protein [Francisella sp. FSC1006]
MLKLREIYHKYIDQDPIKVFQDGAIKSAVILFVFLGVTSYFQIDKNLIIISILFIANLAGSILMGSIPAKRVAFVLYMITAIVVVNISPYVHSMFQTDFMLIVFVVFVAFWTRRFGEAFAVFPVMVVVITCIAFIRYPLAKSNHLDFTFTAILIGLAFYLILIRSYKIMNEQDIKKVTNEFIKLFVRTYIDTFEKARYRRFSQTDVLEVSNMKHQNINSFKSHGLMFLKTNNHEDWRYLSHNFVVFNRLSARFLLIYKKLNLNYLSLGFKDANEVQELSQDLEKIYKETLFLMLYIQKDSERFEKKEQELSHLKYKLEINHIQKYQHDSQKRGLLFDSILLLDDMMISLENIREAYYDLI